MEKRKPSRELLFLLLLVSVLPSANAQQVRYYDVELVVFEHLDARTRQSEAWPEEIPSTPPEEVIQLGRPYPGRIPDTYDPMLTFKPLKNIEYSLNKAVAALEASERYRILLHQGWRQPGMDKKTALSVRIDHQVPPSPIAHPSTSGTFNGESHPTKDYRLEGYIQLILARYLHLEIDLAYHEIQSEGSTDSLTNIGLTQSIPTVVYHLQQTRRLRSGELHYLDHPVLGILTKITPYKPEKTN